MMELKLSDLLRKPGDERSQPVYYYLLVDVDGQQVKIPFEMPEGGKITGIMRIDASETNFSIEIAHEVEGDE